MKNFPFSKFHWISWYYGPFVSATRNFGSDTSFPLNAKEMYFVPLTSAEANVFFL